MFFVFSIANSIKNAIKKIYYSAQELLSKILSYFGINIIPKHFTKDDIKNYHDWIYDHREQIFDILGMHNGDRLLPTYLQLAFVDGQFYQTNGEYSVDNFVEAGISVQQSFMYEHIQNINTKIREFHQREKEDSSSFAQYFGADQTKMSPRNMVINFLKNYCSQTAVNYNYNNEDLVGLNKVIAYLQQLTSKPSIKLEESQQEFYDLLKDIESYLIEARNQIEVKIAQNEFRNGFDAMIINTKTWILMLTRFFFVLFNFYNRDTATLPTDIQASLSSTPSSKINRWLAKVIEYSRSDIDISAMSRATYLEMITDISLVGEGEQIRESSLFMQDLIPPIKGELTLDKIANLQKLTNTFLDIVSIYKILLKMQEYIIGFQFSRTCETFIRLNQIILILKEKTDSLQDKMENLNFYSEKIQVYMTQQIPAWETEKYQNLLVFINAIQNFYIILRTSIDNCMRPTTKIISLQSGACPSSREVEPIFQAIHASTRLVKKSEEEPPLPASVSRVVSSMRTSPARPHEQGTEISTPPRRFFDFVKERLKIGTP